MRVRHRTDAAVAKGASPIGHTLGSGPLGVDRVFMTEDIVIDPNGTRGIGPAEGRFGSSLAGNGFFGFRDADEIIVVHMRHIAII